MAHKGQKLMWSWHCIYDRGSGKDREVCFARSKRGHKTELLAKRAGAKHLINCFHSYVGGEIRTLKEWLPRRM